MANKQRIINKRFGYKYVSGKPVFTIGPNTQLNLHSICLINNSSQGGMAGIGVSMPSRDFKLFTYQAGIAVLAEDTFVGFTSNAGDGFILQSKTTPSIITFEADSVSGSPVLDFKYWNGTAFVSLTAQKATLATGTNVYIIAPPFDWQVGSDIVGTDTSLYTLIITASTAPSADVNVSAFLPAQGIVIRDDVGSLQALSVAFEDHQYLLNQGEYLLPYFEHADDNNVLEISYRINP